MRALLGQKLDQIRAFRTRFRKSTLTQTELDGLSSQWEFAKDPAELEQLAVCGIEGQPTGVYAPRWLAHLLGIPHATAHVGLITPSGLVVLQLRSPRKAQFPNAWDMAVTGHLAISAQAVRAPISAEEAAARELEEELGLDAARLNEWLRNGRLEPVGSPRVSFGEGETADRPWCDVEVRQLFAGVLTSAGVAGLSYQSEELSGVLLCRPVDAIALLNGPNAAAGALRSLEDLLNWHRSSG